MSLWSLDQPVHHTKNFEEILSQVGQGVPIRLALFGEEDGRIDGQLVGRRPEFPAIHATDARARLDGFLRARYKGLSSVSVPAPLAGLVERVFKLRGQAVATSIQRTVDL